MKYQETAKVLKAAKVAPEHFRITLKASKISKAAQPGQFVMIRCGTSTDPLLRRPISFNSIDRKNLSFDIMFKVIGKGTKFLANLKAGDSVDIIGPLGKGFEPDKSRPTAVIVGGGAGIAPLLALAQHLKGKAKKIYALIGANTKEAVLLKRDFAGLGCKTIVSTDDGSSGEKGMVSDVLIDLMSKELSAEKTQIFACGPRSMIKALKDISKRSKIAVQVSLEEWMACGVGACFGCTVKTRSGYQKVCSDGPVFNIEELV